MSLGLVLSISQEDKCGAILVSKVPRTYSWHAHPVRFIPVFQFYLSLPTVEMAQGPHHHQTFKCHQRLVALQGPGVLQMVDVMGEHQDHEVSESSLVGEPLVLGLSGGVVTHIVFSSKVELA